MARLVPGLRYCWIYGQLGEGNTLEGLMMMGNPRRPMRGKVTSEVIRRGSVGGAAAAVLADTEVIAP